MEKIIRKPYWNFEKEVAWLNHMAQSGWALKKYTWMTYVFEPCKKGEYEYYIDLLEKHHKQAESCAFIDMVEETGVKYVTGYLRWVYFAKKADGKPFELYTDLSSKIKQLTRINRFWTILIAAEFGIGFGNLGIWAARGADEATTLNLVAGIVVLCVGALLMTVVYPVRIKIRALMKEKKIMD